jgi:hypothetical protein
MTQIGEWKRGDYGVGYGGIPRRPITPDDIPSETQYVSVPFPNAWRYYINGAAVGAANPFNNGTGIKWVAVVYTKESEPIDMASDKDRLLIMRIVEDCCDAPHLCQNQRTS